METIGNMTLAEVHQLSQGYYMNGMEQLDKAIYDDKRAKQAALTGLVVGTLLLSGDPGGGKTSLAKYLGAIVEDIAPEDVCRIPVDSELQPSRLVGSSTTIETVEEINGVSTTKKTIHRIEPLVKPSTGIIFADELTRINPLAVNALLEAPEESALTTTEGTIALDSLMLLVSTMNPAESIQSTFDVAVAYASRHKVGAVMGRDITHAHKKDLSNGIKPRRDEIVPIVSTDQLKLIKQSADLGLLPEKLNDTLVESVNRAIVTYQQDHGIKESNNRYTEQIGQVTKVLALFSGDQPDIKHLYDAMYLSVAARLGSLVISDNIEGVIKNFVEKVIA
ncbi:MAG: AAA family ATPase [Candidatus Saccharibacteria bacterium]